MSRSTALKLPSFDTKPETVVLESEPVETALPDLMPVPESVPVEGEIAIAEPDTGEEVPLAAGMGDLDPVEVSVEAVSDLDDHWEPDSEPLVADAPSVEAVEDFEIEFDDEFGDVVDLPEQVDESPLELADLAVDVDAVSAPESMELSEKLDAVSALVEELSRASDALSLEIASRVEDRVQGIASAIFPKLTEAFLAEELSSFLSSAVPRDTPVLDIHVPAPLVDDLSASLARTPALGSICELHALPENGPPIVKARWADGGLDYDLSSLLTACHARALET